jgi:hypothetical protein
MGMPIVCLPHPALSKGEGSKEVARGEVKILSFGADLGEANNLQSYSIFII